MMRGRVLKLNGTPVENVKAREKVAWVLEGDRGITFAPAVPEGSTLKEGTWWAADYTGPPVVSVDAGIADGLGLKLGDTITVNVLGRTLTAKIANLRTVDWRKLGINFVFVFSPNTFAGAPHTGSPPRRSRERAAPIARLELLRDAATAFPAVTTVRVKDALDALNDIVGQLALAIRGASSVALVASVLVLAGALAAGQRSRLYDAVVLKTLGATRWRLLGAHGARICDAGCRDGRVRRAGRCGRRLGHRHARHEARRVRLALGFCRHGGARGAGRHRAARPRGHMARSRTEACELPPRALNMAATPAGDPRPEAL